MGKLLFIICRLKTLILGRKLEHYKAKHANVVIREDMINPIDAFFLIRRLSWEWEEVENLLNSTASEDLGRIASEQDLQGAAVALSRIHDTYGLNITEVSEGFLLGTRHSQPLTTEDCFEIGQEIESYGDEYYAMMWLREALRKCESKDMKADIIDSFHPILYNSKHPALALALVDRLLAMEPMNREAQEFQKQYQAVVGEANLTYDEIFTADFHRKRNPDDLLDPEFRLKYNRLCQGHTDKSPKRQATLKCRYVYENSVFTRLAPFKLEEVYRNPDIVVYHDVISDEEIGKIQNLTKPLVSEGSLGFM
jgi:prolyl 4-hydroxylase